VWFSLSTALLMLAFFVPEFVLRKEGAAKGTTPVPADRGSTFLLLSAYLVALLASAFVGRIAIGRVALTTRWVGLGAMVCGLGLRVWAMAVLGKFYTRTLLTAPDQRVVDRGPYRWLRHPGYLGSLLVWVGSGFAHGNWLLAAVIASLMLPAYGHRIASEERLLRGCFGGAYESYTRKTWRLVPFLF
jgi:protein-S-isoprenylcysteine O-methyltransferase Ste14